MLGSDVKRSVAFTVHTLRSCDSAVRKQELDAFRCLRGSLHGQSYRSMKDKTIRVLGSETGAIASIPQTTQISDA